MSFRRTSKYGVRMDPAGKAARTVDGRTFASKAEAARYQELRWLERAGEVRDLKLQPGYVLMAAVVEGGLQDINAGVLTRSAPVGSYRADFSFYERHAGAWRFVVEDVKGMRTEMYQWKKRHFEQQYGIEIREITRRR